MALDKFISGLTNNSALTGALSGAAGGALVSAFTNKKSAKKLLKAGGLVAVGGLAYKAYQSYRAGQSAESSQPLPEIPQTQFEALVAQDAPAHSTALVLQSMISAAHADNHLTDTEQQQIWQQALSLNLPAADLAALSEQLQHPATVTELAAAADSMELKIEMYTAAAVVIDESCEAGRQHLAEFATALALPPQLASALHAQLAAPQAAA